MLIAMCLINKFLFDWLSQKNLLWDAQDRDGTLLPWRACLKTLYPISILGFVLATYTCAYIFPLMTERALLIMHMPHDSISIILMKGTIIFPTLVMLSAPAIARLTSRTFPFMKKMKWLQTPYDMENLYPVVRRTYHYTEELRRMELNTFTFEKALCDPWFTIRHIGTQTGRKKKFLFWKEKLAGKAASAWSVQEKFQILRCPELWEFFFLKHTRP